MKSVYVEFVFFSSHRDVSCLKQKPEKPVKSVLIWAKATTNLKINKIAVVFLHETRNSCKKQKTLQCQIHNTLGGGR